MTEREEYEKAREEFLNTFWNGNLDTVTAMSGRLAANWAREYTKKEFISAAFAKEEFAEEVEIQKLRDKLAIAIKSLEQIAGVVGFELDNIRLGGNGSLQETAKLTAKKALDKINKGEVNETYISDCINDTDGL